MKRFLTAFYFFLGFLWVTQAPEAAENFMTADRQSIRDLEALHWRAEKLVEAGNFRAAAELYWEIILIEPDDESAYANLGELYLILGDMDRARDAFLNALHINPENQEAQNGLYRIANPDGLAV